MDQKVIASSLVALIVGFAIGYIGAPNFPSLNEIQDSVGEVVAPTQSATEGLNERIAALEEQIAGVSDSVSSLGTQMSEQNQNEAFSSLASSVSDLGGSVESAMTANAEAQSQMSDTLAALSGALAGSGSQGGSEGSDGGSSGGESGQSDSGQSGDQSANQQSGEQSGDQSGEQSGDQSGEESGDQSNAGASGEQQQASGSGESDSGGDAAIETGIAIGQTARLADGRVRVFLSLLDIPNDTARVGLNGATMRLAAGQTVDVPVENGTCAITLDAMSNLRAAFSANCSDSGSEGEGSSEESASGDSDAMPAAESTDISGPGLAAGQTALLGDGAARVFVSGITADETVARLAVNGLSVQQVNAGQSVEIPDSDGCAVTLSAIAGNRVHLTYGCGN